MVTLGQETAQALQERLNSVDMTSYFDRKVEFGVHYLPMHRTTEIYVFLGEGEERNVEMHRLPLHLPKLLLESNDEKFAEVALHYACLADPSFLNPTWD